jgi:hypothetical protein
VSIVVPLGDVEEGKAGKRDAIGRLSRRRKGNWADTRELSPGATAAVKPFATRPCHWQSVLNGTRNLRGSCCESWCRRQHGEAGPEAGTGLEEVRVEIPGELSLGLSRGLCHTGQG